MSCLPERRVDHELEAGVVLDAAVAQHLPRLRHVVLLVEDRGAAVGGAAEAREPDGRRDQPEHERHDESAQAVGRRGRAEHVGGLRGRACGGIADRFDAGGRVVVGGRAAGPAVPRMADGRGSHGARS
jgi:hypothetical protein